MTIREKDNSKEFVNKLKNVSKPINDTSTSPEMESYLAEINDVKIDKTKKKEEEKIILFCPHCRRPSLKRTPQLTYTCVHCGLTTTSPLKMAEKK